MPTPAANRYASAPGPSPEAIAEARRTIAGTLVRTPNLALASDRIAPHLPEGSRVAMKLELFQQAGSFKARGAYLGVAALDEAAAARGIVAVSAGNHALAAAWAAQAAGVSAVVVMPRHVDPVRIAGCEAMGARVVLCDDVGAAFAALERIAAEEGRTVIHPFEGEMVTLGTATCGAEFIEDVPDLDMVVVPVGGGGLISGMARAVKLARPDCAVWGVEPFGADAMYRSLEAGAPVRLERVDTVADSLGAPMALPYSFGVTQAHVEGVVRVEDAEMLRAMRLLFDATKLACEPACAAALAALMGPLREKAAGKRVGVIACGSNIGPAKFAGLLEG